MFKSYFVFVLVTLSILSACSSQPVVVKPLPPPIVAVPPLSTNKPAISPSDVTPNKNSSTVNTNTTTTPVLVPTIPNKTNGISVDEARLLLQSLLPTGIKDRSG